MAASFFGFEQDFVGSLRCIPMVVRHHLDTCGVKLKLDHWNRFSPAERQALVDWPCETPAQAAEYRSQLQRLIVQQTGSPAKTLAVAAQPDWQNLQSIPDAVLAKFAEQRVPLALQQWADLDELQRFALIKLSRPSHENRNFMPAVEEFGLLLATEQVTEKSS
ncbi:MAG: nitrate reductase associated protein [Cyanobacteria bacterium J06627_32]